MSLLADYSAESLESPIQDALRAWHQTADEPGPALDGLLTVRALQAQMADDNGDVTARAATYHLLENCIAQLTVQDPVLGAILRQRFVDNQIGQRVAATLNLSRHQVNRRQKRALAELAALVSTREAAARAHWITEQESGLEPPTAERLHGVAAAEAALLPQLDAPGAPWIVVLSGMGGVGKSALARQLTCRLIPRFRFDHHIWLHVPVGADSAETPPPSRFGAVARRLADQFPDTPWPTDPDDLAHALRQRLKQAPHLVVIDNLGAETDTVDLIHRLNHWTDPSRFLLVTREQPTTQAGGYLYRLAELDRPTAAALVTEHAGRIGLPELAHADAQTFDRIYALTGGNPLALKLVVSLAHRASLPVILDDLGKARSQHSETLFRHIYERAWRVLSADARALLRAMAQAPASTVTFDRLAALNVVAPEAILDALDELISHSLLEIRGDAWHRRYAVHRLTCTFLRNNLQALFASAPAP